MYCIQLESHDGDLMFSQHCLWFKCSGMWRCIIDWVVRNILKDCSASIFMVTWRWSLQVYLCITLHKVTFQKANLQAVSFAKGTQFFVVGSKTCFHSCMSSTVFYMRSCLMLIWSSMACAGISIYIMWTCSQNNHWFHFPFWGVLK